MEPCAVCSVVHRVVIGTGTELMDIKIILHFFIVHTCGLVPMDCVWYMCGGQKALFFFFDSVLPCGLQRLN